MDRIRSADTFRVLAIVAVIALHTARHDGERAVGHGWDLPTLLDGAERFAVPLFFILSGYFWARGGAGPHARWLRAVRLCRRVLTVYAGWVLVYAAVGAIGAIWNAGTPAALHELAAAWRGHRMGVQRVLLEGLTPHLWYLPALACAVLISGALLARRQRALLIALAIVLFAFGLAGKAYALTPLGWPTRFNLRDGPFFGLLFFVTGIELRRWRLPAAAWPGLLVALAGCALQLLEVRWLHLRFGAAPVQDFVASTWLYGLCAGLMALSDAPALRLPALAALGPLVLGIYASHYLFVDWLRPLDERWRAWPAWDVLYVALVFAGALALTRLLARWRPGRRLVM
ncbi:acyltransferase [Massilia sp. 9096]|uniref:acyltransferase n=1 Tax=Massilia sp. 9096 TaxID=1500894 RepID=UPI00055AF0C5|nr:acyltransferase family protein [Massilia sp. 9096]